MILFFSLIWNKKFKNKEFKSLNDTEEQLCCSDHKQDLAFAALEANTLQDTLAALVQITEKTQIAR